MSIIITVLCNISYCLHLNAQKRPDVNGKSGKNNYYIVTPQWAKKFKKVQEEKHVKSKFHEIFLGQIPFLQFQKWPKINFSTENKV